MKPAMVHQPLLEIHGRKWRPEAPVHQSLPIFLWQPMTHGIVVKTLGHACFDQTINLCCYHHHNVNSKLNTLNKTSPGETTALLDTVKALMVKLSVETNYLAAIHRITYITVPGNTHRLHLVLCIYQWYQHHHHCHINHHYYPTLEHPGLCLTLPTHNQRQYLHYGVRELCLLSQNHTCLMAL